MRKTFIALSTLAAISMPAAASAQSAHDPAAGAKLATGAAVGTVAGLGLYHGWWGSGAFASSLPASAAGAAVAGGVAGIGTAVLIDAATQPCRGFRALFSPFVVHGHSGCVNGEWVGYRQAQYVPRRR